MQLARRERQPLEVHVQMTPMIDVVFQLLIFFLCSFRIIDLEGDLAMKLPRDGAGDTLPASHFLPPVTVHLDATDAGELAAIRWQDERLNDTAQLRRKALELATQADFDRSELRVDLVCDARLRYEHAMAALTALSGRRDGSGSIEPLIEDVRLASREASR